MAITYGFFNSVNQDRLYNADQMSEYFKGLISDGIYESVGGALQVQAASGMTVNVQTGRALIDCKWIDNSSVVSLDITQSHPTLNRYTSVVIRLDRTNRLMEIATKDGTPASSPTVPTMENDLLITELCLANIYVGAGVTSITQENITDMRASGSCGWVTWLISNTNIIRTYADYTVTKDNTTYIDLPSSLNYISSDILDVFVGGILLSPTEYTIMTNEVTGGYMIKVNNDLDSGNVVTFICIKSSVENSIS